MGNVIQLFFTLFSYIVPKKKNLIIFGSGNARLFNGNPKYMYMYLHNNNNNNNNLDIEYYWSTKSKEVFERLDAKNYPVINARSLKGFFRLLRAKYLVIEMSSIDVSYTRSIIGRFNFVQSNHGTPLKKVGDDAITIINNPTLDRFMKKFKIYSKLRYKYFVSASDEVDKIVLSAFGNKNIVTTGYPRNDVFFNKKLLFYDYQKKFGLKNYRKVFFYAPTFRDNYSNVIPFSTKISYLNDYLAENNSIMLVKKHPNEKVLSIPDNLSNIKDISFDVDDIQEILPFVDVLITDYSSTFFDFILTNKPVIYYSYDLEDYLDNCRGMYYDYYSELTGPFAKNEDELIDLIKNIEIWSQEDDYLNRYQKQVEKFNKYRDGNSSKRLLKLLFAGS